MSFKSAIATRFLSRAAASSTDRGPLTSMTGGMNSASNVVTTAEASPLLGASQWDLPGHRFVADLRWRRYTEFDKKGSLASRWLASYLPEARSGYRSEAHRIPVFPSLLDAGLRAGQICSNGEITTVGPVRSNQSRGSDHCSSPRPEIPPSLGDLLALGIDPDQDRHRSNPRQRLQATDQRLPENAWRSRMRSM